jgi:hypothetical protein
MFIDDRQRAAFQPVLTALTKFPKEHGVPALLAVRPGYRYAAGEGGTITATPVIVAAVAPDALGSAADQAASKLTDALGVPVVAQQASVDEQIANFDKKSGAIQPPASPMRSQLEQALRNTLPATFAVRRKPAYKPPSTVRLRRVRKRMGLTLAVSPDAGWPVLRDFLAGAESSLTMGMYEMTAPHVADALEQAVGRIHGDFLLTLHPVPERQPKPGAKAQDINESDVLGRLQAAAGDRFGFQWAPVGADFFFANAYHIKVVVADGQRFWLSSGNMQSSNQAPFDFNTDEPDPDFRKKYNREYHVVCDCPELAAMYEGFLKYDFQSAEQMGHHPPKNWDGPDVVVPADFEPTRFAAIPIVPPLALDPTQERDVEPLLTPDNYAERLFDLIRGAEGRLWFQNQYIKVTDDNDVIEPLVRALIELQGKPGFDLRIICRDQMDSASLDTLVSMGLDPNKVRFQHNCHNKCVLIDSKITVVGSHNWSNSGVGFNRDASLVIYDEEATRYFEKVYKTDWDKLATAHPATPRRGSRVRAAGTAGGGDDAGEQDLDG